MSGDEAPLMDEADTKFVLPDTDRCSNVGRLYG